MYICLIGQVLILWKAYRQGTKAEIPAEDLFLFGWGTFGGEFLHVQEGVAKYEFGIEDRSTTRLDGQ
jgi:hypothetical protein